MSANRSVERVSQLTQSSQSVQVSHGRTDKDGLTKKDSPTSEISANATPAGGQNESIPGVPDEAVDASRNAVVRKHHELFRAIGSTTTATTSPAMSAGLRRRSRLTTEVGVMLPEEMSNAALAAEVKLLRRELAHAERDAAVAAVERVRALHRPLSEGGGRTVCSTCLAYTSPMPACIPWPCATVRALDPGAEPGEQR